MWSAGPGPGGSSLPGRAGQPAGQVQGGTEVLGVEGRGYTDQFLEFEDPGLPGRPRHTQDAQPLGFRRARGCSCIGASKTRLRSSPRTVADISSIWHSSSLGSMSGAVVGRARTSVDGHFSPRSTPES